jgi:sigma-B regulation protein RsbU (phosphoserine phosphatase)
MDFSVFGILWALIERACLLLVVFLVLFHIKFFKRMAEQKLNVLDQFILAVLFGCFALYGTYSGIQTSGAIANIRNVGPIMGGLIGGPWMGLGAGLIGGSNLGIWKPTIFAFLMETADMSLLLLIAQPSSSALKLVSIIAAPMILANTFAIAVFAFLLRDMKPAPWHGR